MGDRTVEVAPREVPQCRSAHTVCSATWTTWLAHVTVMMHPHRAALSAMNPPV
jgi:hypothetical protein